MRLSAALAGSAALAAAIGGCGGSSHAAAAPARASTSFDPVSVTAVSEADFWVLGTSRCGRRTCLSIRRTRDGGRTFVRVAAPALPTQGTVPTLRFADRSDGFAFVPGVGGVFYATHDGGATWRRLSLRTVLAFATGGGYAYVVTARCSRAACTQYRFERSPVSATVWTARRLPFAPDGSPVDLAVHGARVWLLGTPAGAAGRHGDALARARDGGRTFVTARGPCTPGLGGELEPASASTIWAVCATGMLSGAWRSTDGGRSFAPLRTPPLVNSASIAPASFATAVLARNGPGSPLLRTADGGRRWRRPAAPPPAGYTPFVGFTDARVGYALVQSGPIRMALWRTTDGGAHWYRVRVG